VNDLDVILSLKQEEEEERSDASEVRDTRFIADKRKVGNSQAVPARPGSKIDRWQVKKLRRWEVNVCVSSRLVVFTKTVAAYPEKRA
jgi:hypothetical protein